MMLTRCTPRSSPWYRHSENLPALHQGTHSSGHLCVRQMEGLENLPAKDEAAVYVANHQSFLVRLHMVDAKSDDTRIEVSFDISLVVNHQSFLVRVAHCIAAIAANRRGASGAFHSCLISTANLQTVSHHRGFSLSPAGLQSPRPAPRL